MIDANKILNYIYLVKSRTKEGIAIFWGYLYIKIYVLAIIILILFNWFFAYFINSKVSQGLVVLHYNVDFGINLIGDVSRIYIIPALGLFIFFINSGLAVVINRQRFENINTVRLLTHLILSGALLSNLFLFISLAFIYLINFYR
jgi:hypothetical protein